MPFPTTAFQVAAVIVLLLPGLVYALVRRHRKGFRPDDLTIDSRIAQALVVSVLLNALYLTFGWSLLDGMVDLNHDPPLILDPWRLGAVVFVGCAVIPAVLAWLLNLPWRARRRREGDQGWNRIPWKFERTIRSSSVPTAWDEAASKPHHRMVRVQFPDGRWIGGFYGPGSFVSTFPQPRDLYISHQYAMSEEGEFLNPIPRTGGVWLRISDEHIVEFLWPNYSDSDGITNEDDFTKEGD